MHGHVSHGTNAVQCGNVAIGNACLLNLANTASTCFSIGAVILSNVELVVQDWDRKRQDMHIAAISDSTSLLVTFLNINNEASIRKTHAPILSICCVPTYTCDGP
jgi:hypothetical protein